MTVPMAKRLGAKNIVGIDLEHGSVKHVLSLLPEAHMAQANAVELPFSPTSMHAVMAIEVSMYFADKRKFFSECNRVLAPGGILVVQLHNSFSYRGLLYSLLFRKNNPQSPYYDLSWWQIESLLHETGFTVLQAIGYNWIPVTFSRPNNPLLGIYASCERFFGLNNLISLSPWLLVAARKTGPATE